MGHFRDEYQSSMEPASLDYQEALAQLRLVNDVFIRSRRYRNLPGASGFVAGGLALAGGSLFLWRWGSIG